MKRLQPDTLIRNPNGLPTVACVDVDCPASRLWGMVGQFSSFDVFVPDLARIDMTGTGVGALRTKFFRDGNCVVEQLNSRDEQAMHMTWSMIYNTLGIARLWAAMQVETLDAHCSRATWTVIAEPTDPAQAGFGEFVQTFTHNALENVRRLLG